MGKEAASVEKLMGPGCFEPLAHQLCQWQNSEDLRQLEQNARLQGEEIPTTQEDRLIAESVWGIFRGSSAAQALGEEAAGKHADVAAAMYRLIPIGVYAGDHGKSAGNYEIRHILEFFLDYLGALNSLVMQDGNLAQPDHDISSPRFVGNRASELERNGVIDGVPNATHQFDLPGFVHQSLPVAATAEGSRVVTPQELREFTSRQLAGFASEADNFYRRFLRQFGLTPK